jgi:hypothetical protein
LFIQVVGGCGAFLGFFFFSFFLDCLFMVVVVVVDASS